MSTRSGLVAVIIPILALALVLFPSQLATAQTETPTPTIIPTPSDSFRVPLTSGAELVIERRITYGEIATVLVMGIALIGAAIYAIVRLVRLWLY